MDPANSTLSIGEGPPRPNGPAALTFVLTAEEPLGLGVSCRHLLADAAEVVVRRGDRRHVQRSGERVVLSLPDRRLSSPHARLARDGASWHIDDLGSKNGVFVNGEHTLSTMIGDGDVLELGYSFFVFRAAVPLLEHTDLIAALPAYPQALVSLNPIVEREFAELRRVAATKLTVLIGGETGTGKELVARAIHELSRRSGPLVAVNCGALPTTLIEAELFGFKKGSFSGADRDHPGLIGASGGGTLFLDEVAELPLQAQATLLRALQEREVLPIGATRVQPVDLRLLAATHRDLDAAVDAGTFRADLHMRLGGAKIQLPPLRARREDLGLLVASLAARLLPDGKAVSLSHRAARTLFARAWPGNVRELERALALALVAAADQPIELASSSSAPSGSTDPGSATRRAVGRPRRVELEALLREHGGNVTAVARRLGKAREQVYRWIRHLGVDPANYRE